MHTSRNVFAPSLYISNPSKHGHFKAKIEITSYKLCNLQEFGISVIVDNLRIYAVLLADMYGMPKQKIYDKSLIYMGDINVHISVF